MVGRGEEKKNMGKSEVSDGESPEGAGRKKASKAHMTEPAFRSTSFSGWSNQVRVVE